MQKEIEIKFKLEKSDNNNLKNWLAQNSKFMGIINITDYYLDNPKFSFYIKSQDQIIEAPNFLRVRVTDKDSFLCFKNRKIDNVGKTVSVDELETKINEPEKILEILKYSGFTEILEIKKTREVYLYNNLFEVVFDNVDNLGNFIEIELKNYSGFVDTGKQEIYNLLKKIGFKKIVEFDRGYLTIFLNPKIDFEKLINL
ncbi:MAG: Adenylate cyclase [candidate division TM6 bacterium GW2011_GWF2_28_16]|nr:MAG: Adenylate cyclase [candidate division TM6 bacterium GW2011_GWF2_28_16]